MRKVPDLVVRQYEICRLKGRAAPISLVVILQSDQLSPLKSRIAAPLIKTKTAAARFKYNPLVEFEGQHFYLAVEQLSMLPTAAVGAAVGTAAIDEFSIKRALDLVFFGS